MARMDSETYPHSDVDWQELLHVYPIIWTSTNAQASIERSNGDGRCDRATLLCLTLAIGPGGMSLRSAATWAVHVVSHRQARAAAACGWNGGSRGAGRHGARRPDRSLCRRRRPHQCRSRQRAARPRRRADGPSCCVSSRRPSRYGCRCATITTCSVLGRGRPV